MLGGSIKYTVCSAHAEVIPHHVGWQHQIHGLLRTRGGDPDTQYNKGDKVTSAPHTRR